MPIQRTSPLDFSHPGFCQIVETTEGTAGQFSQEGERRHARDQEGYAPHGQARHVPAMDIQIALPRYVTQTVSLYSPSGRHIKDVPITDTDIINIDISIYAILSIKRGIDAKIASEIEQTFASTTINFSDVDTAEESLIKAGASLNDYWVDLVMRGRSRLPAILPTRRAEEFCRVMNELRDSNGKPVYGNVHLSERYVIKCKGESFHLPDDQIVVVEDPIDPRKEIEERAERADDGCENLEAVIYHITDFNIPEVKTEWERQEIKICGVRIGETDVPVIYTRNSHVYLYGSVTSPRAVAQLMAKVFLDCMRDAAITTGVAQLITAFDALPGAQVIFTTALSVCLETKLPDGLKCIGLDLPVVVEHSEWQRH